MTSQRAAVCAGLLLMGACNRSADSDPADTDTDTDLHPDSAESGSAAEVTYHGDARGLIAEHCLSCHADGGVGPFSLERWEDVEPLAPLVVGAVTSGGIPPWGQDETCRPTAGTMAVTAAQQDAFAAWRDGGFSAGDPDDFVPPPVDDPMDRRPPDITLVASAPYAVSAARPDDYRCLPMPHDFPHDTFVRELTVLPDRTELVHHAIVFAVPPAGLDALDTLDNADEGPGWDCSGDTGPAKWGDRAAGSFPRSRWLPRKGLGT